MKRPVRPSTRRSDVQTGTAKCDRCRQETDGRETRKVMLTAPGRQYRLNLCAPCNQQLGNHLTGRHENSPKPQEGQRSNERTNRNSDGGTHHPAQADAMRAMQWSNSHPKMVTLHICRVFRQETSGFQQAVVRRSENLDLIPSEKVGCPGLRRRN